MGIQISNKINLKDEIINIIKKLKESGYLLILDHPEAVLSENVLYDYADIIDDSGTPGYKINYLNILKELNKEDVDFNEIEPKKIYNKYLEAVDFAYDTLNILMKTNDK